MVPALGGVGDLIFTVGGELFKPARQGLRSLPGIVQKGQLEISQTRCVWRIAPTESVLTGRRNPSSFQDESSSPINYQPLRSWLISIVALRRFAILPLLSIVALRRFAFPQLILRRAVSNSEFGRLRPLPGIVPKGQLEISQTRCVWCIAPMEYVLSGRRNPSSFQDESSSPINYQPLRSWLISIVASRRSAITLLLSIVALRRFAIPLLLMEGLHFLRRVIICRRLAPDKTDSTTHEPSYIFLTKRTDLA
jgi:hypothetical protein